MTRDELINEYFEWMYQLVSEDMHRKKLSYRRLLQHLHTIEFVYILPLDANREADGIDLRYRFGYENGYSDPMISSYLDDRPCSVFEMMVALSLRCEENIMNDPEIGDRLGHWFWSMIHSLGLESMTDSRFDRRYVDRKIDIFLNRKYERNGRGGLVTIENCKVDLRSVDIWYQMNWYLTSIM